MTKALVEAETDSFFDDDSSEVPPSDIIAYNESRSCADLFRMFKSGILDIQPEFQREIVWNDSAQTRFLDSLIKQLPIPSLCFSMDYKAGKWQVIDGLQRMASIIRFLGGDRRIRTSIHRAAISETIKKTHGFEYERHFLTMLVSVIGRQGIEAMERKVDPAKFVPLSGALNDMKTRRNAVAHTFLKGTTMTIDAPSATSVRFGVIFIGLKEVERVLLQR